MTPIKILNSSLMELATIAVASSAVRTEKINSDNILNFSIRVKDSASSYITDTNVVELDGDYFDIAYYKKEQQADGKLMVSVECEHVSYRLNDSDYNIDLFAMTDTPTTILAAILADTGFTVGTVSFATSTTFSLQEGTSRRSLLMQFAAYLGGELEFNGFEISLLTARGNTTPTALTVGKDIMVMSKAVNRREFDSLGNPVVTYTCGVYKGASLALGDVVTLDYDSLDISVSLRVVSKSYDPYNPNRVTIEVGNYTNSLEDDLYRIETSTVSKDKLYYGAKIGPENGFESVRSDKFARAFFNADNFKMQSGDGTGENWVDELYFDPVSKKYIFNGTLSATVLEAVEANIDIIVSNTFITQNLYAARGTIAELTVDRLDTSDKVANYLASDKADVNYQQIYDQHFKWITATYAGDVDGQDNKIQLTDRNGSAVYWTDDTFTGTTMDVTAYPVYIYVYDELTKLEIYFDLVDGVYTPIMVWGAGTGNSEHPEYGRGFDFKDTIGRVMRYITSTGVTQDIRNGENGIEFIGDTSNNYYSATNAAAVTVNTAETVVCTKDIAFSSHSKVIINFSCTIVTTGGALNATAKVYVGGTALPFQPKAYQTSANSWVLSFCDDKKNISSGNKTIAVKLVTDANSGTVAIGQSKMIVQVFTDPMPELVNASNFTATVASSSQINLAWTNPTGEYFNSVEIYRSTVDLASKDRGWCSANATLVYSGNGESYNNTGLTAQTTYYYKVFSKYILGEEADYSAGIYASATTEASAYQLWSNSPDTPASAPTSVYPYQCIMKIETSKYLFCSKTKMYFWSSAYLYGTDFKKFNYDNGWVDAGGSGITKINTYTNIFVEANNDVYTDSTFTTVHFAKTT